MRFVFVSLFSFMLLHVSYVSAQEPIPSIQDADENSVAEPDVNDLVDAGDEPDVVTPDGTRGISAPSAILPGDGDDVFFDANDLVPQGEMSREGPNKVSPITQPASKLVIVKKNFESDTQEAQIVSAERAMALGRYESALVLFDALYRNNKSDARILMGRAVTLQKLNRFDEAMQVYEALSKIEPDNLDVKINMLGLLGTRYPAVALRRLKALAEDNPGHPALAAQLAFAYAQNADATSALRFLGVAASLEPTNANHVFNQAVIADRIGERALAVQYYEKALEIDTIHGAGRTIPRDVVYARLSEIR